MHCDRTAMASPTLTSHLVGWSWMSPPTAEPRPSLILERPLLGLGNYRASARPLSELSAIPPWCVLLKGKWSSSETTQKGDTQPTPPCSPHARAQVWFGPLAGEGSPRRWQWWWVGWERGPQTRWVLPRAVWQLGQEAWAHGGREETKEGSAAPPGHMQLPVSAETSFQKQSLSFFNHLSPHGDPLL